MKKSIGVLDTTLRDGAQSASVSYTVKDKLKILDILDALGIGFAEAGAPAAVAKDEELFLLLKRERVRFRTLKPVAFHSTCREGVAACEDELLKKAVALADEYVSLYGKSSLAQVVSVIRTSGDENLRMIADSVAYCRENGKRVIFEGEHFFDGFRADPDYALQTLVATVNAGAERVVLCDTNGGSMPGTHNSTASTNRIANSDSKVAMTIGITPTRLKYDSLNSLPMENAIKPRAASEMISSCGKSSAVIMPPNGQFGIKDGIAGPRSNPAIRYPVTFGRRNSLANRPNAIPAKIITDKTRSVCICNFNLPCISA